MKNLKFYAEYAFQWLKDKGVFDFLKRHLSTIAIGAIALLILQPDGEMISGLVRIALLASISLLVAGFSLFAFTKVKFTEKLTNDGDSTIDSAEKIANAIVVASIYIGSAIVVVYSWFQLQFTH